MVRSVIVSIPQAGTTELFLIPASVPIYGMVHITDSLLVFEGRKCFI